MEDHFSGTYDKLVCNDDFTTDELPVYSQEKQQVSVSMLRPESNRNHYRALAVSLAVFAFILLLVDIGLGVYYNKLDGHNTISDISNEVAKLQATYNTAVQSRDEAKKQLAKVLTEQQLTKWELEHQIRRKKSYENQQSKVQTEIAILKSHLPMLIEGCRQCLPGWTFLNSACYYFPFSEAHARRSWQDARTFCKKHGADLAVIESTEEHLAVFNLINNYQDSSRQVMQSGYWIGLSDVDEEGMWRWLDGTILTEGYWNDGEPNNQGNEDCAATYPRSNPFKAWNDAPCNYVLKWICEMAPKSEI